MSLLDFIIIYLVGVFVSILTIFLLNRLKDPCLRYNIGEAFFFSWYSWITFIFILFGILSIFFLRFYVFLNSSKINEYFKGD